MGATASQASFVILHNSVRGLSEAIWRADERETVLEGAIMRAGAKASALNKNAAAKTAVWKFSMVALRAWDKEN